jgi:2-oxoglutarate ferredoxin oxidoreductase subunit beta
LNPIELAKVAGCKFAKGVNSTDFALMKETIKEAIQHKGFSLVNIYQVCPSFKRW